MVTITLKDFYSNIREYIQTVINGEEIIISKEKKPLFQIEPIVQKGKKNRPYGLCKGEFTVPDNFDEELPKEIIADFIGR